MLKFILGLIIGANISLFLYACILAGKKSDEEVIQYENSQNYNKK